MFRDPRPEAKNKPSFAAFCSYAGYHLSLKQQKQKTNACRITARMKILFFINKIFITQAVLPLQTIYT
jgi:hypothetical protein